MKEISAKAHGALEKAIASVLDGDLDAGIEHARIASAEAPDWLDPMGHAAGFYTSRGMYKEALALYERILKLDPGNPHACLLAAELCMALSQYDRAGHYNSEAQKVEGPDPQAFEHQKERIGQLQARTHGLAAKIPAPISGFIAHCLWRAGKRQSALKLLECAAGASTNPGVWTKLGQIRFDLPVYDSKTKFQDSAAALHQALEHGGQQEQIRTLLAKIFFQRGDLQEARKQCRQTKEINPDALETGQIEAQIDVLSGNYEQAIEKYDRLRQLDPGDGFIEINQGVLYLKSGKADKASECFATANKKMPGNPLSAFFSELKDQTIFENRKGPWGQKYTTTQKARRIGKKTARFLTGTIRQFCTAGFKRIACNICGSHRYRHLCFCTGNGWRIVRCADCGLVYTNPQPRPGVVHGLYQEDYWEGARALGAEAFHQNATSPDALQEIDIPLFEWLNGNGFDDWANSLSSNHRALDIGCGSGIFMRELINRGWEASGTEVAEDVVALCRRSGLDVHQGTLETAPWPKACFDFASMHHVIEHVNKPGELLQQARGLLRMGGRLLVRTPCCDTVTSALSGSDWFHDPDHIYFFSQSTLSRAISQNGFRILGSLTTVGVQYETWNETWYASHLNDAVGEYLEESNQGDVLVILAEAE